MITVVGSSNTDFSLRVASFPSVGETVLGSELFICGGGKGANQAACIAKLGGEVNFIAKIGDDYFGRLSIKNLNKLGVSTKFVKIDKVRHSGAAFILIDKNGRNMIAVSSGSNMHLKLGDILRRAGCIKKSNVVLTQLEVPLEAVKAALYLAKRFGKTTILNPAPVYSRLSRDILSKVDILVPNECELAMLTGHKGVETGGSLLLKMGVGCVIITRGKKGVLLVINKKTQVFKAKKVKVVDTTCAGDAFCGALALGLDKGRPIEDAIEFANSVAALTVCKLGAQRSLPTLREVKNFVNL